ncbi:transglutaminase family protein [Methylocystis bryophila]|uniref:Transglutaminase n=1 Tax=Methylocystis bryophila TaxID=655015 RepID=A0A1W6MW03_9HYPH|nr:transglutaminase family protein [Methylocystis bryophila]ARN81781.1 transglutaminase [Methylocystis bryophila]BDV37841.1 transglutaminase [Methylocystis bryophila]
MLIRVRHETIYRYDAPAKSTMQRLLVTPRNHEGQHVREWRIDVDRDCCLVAGKDAFGNIEHRFFVEGPLQSLTTLVEGEVETFDQAGVVSGAVERFPVALFLRETALTRPDAALASFARDIGGRESSTLAKLHALMAAIHDKLALNPDATHAAAGALALFEKRCGAYQDFAHVFIACARALGIPSRYVSGYLRRDDSESDQVAGHAWAEAHVEGLGWVGFDPVHALCPNESYVRVAMALDALGAAPVRGARVGGGAEETTVHMRVEDSRAQSQS